MRANVPLAKTYGERGPWRRPRRERPDALADALLWAGWTYGLGILRSVAGAILDVVKPWPRVRLWEWFLIFMAVGLPLGLLVGDALPGAKGAVIAALALVIISGLDQRRRRRSYAEAERQGPTHAPSSTCCSPRSDDA